mmetsp:Transcript_16894/g.21372  ORF Transcript_16894/g.21372 Transcript_16894/m.21372 type:complete len:111 (+) Transcript_16894:92-424(+)
MVFPLPKSCLSFLTAAVVTKVPFMQQQTRSMSKNLSKAAAKRRPLTTKRAGKGYYKGKGSTTQGSFRGKAGRYVLDRSRMLELVIPDLTGFKLKPYIGKNVPKWAPEDRF